MDPLELKLAEPPPGTDPALLHLKRGWNELRSWGKRVSDNMKRVWSARAVDASATTLWANPWDYLRYGAGVSLVALPDPAKHPGVTIALEPTTGIPVRCVSTSRTSMEGREWLPAEGLFVSHLGVWRRKVQQWHHESMNLYPDGYIVRKGPLMAQQHTTTEAGAFLVQFDPLEMVPEMAYSVGNALIHVDVLVTCVPTSVSVATTVPGTLQIRGYYVWTGHPDHQLTYMYSGTQERVGTTDFNADTPYVTLYSALDNRLIQAYVSQNVHAHPGGGAPVYYELNWTVSCQATYAGQV